MRKKQQRPTFNLVKKEVNVGDSSVSCAFSGLTLQNEAVVFIPLVETKYSNTAGARMIVLGSQACALFSPLTLPYRGEVDSYGQLEEIQKDANTAAIQVGMGMSIESFSEACCLGGKIKVDGQEIIGRGCFIHAGIYDRFSKPVRKGTDSCWNHDHAGAADLEAIGCQIVKDLNAEPEPDPNESLKEMIERIVHSSQERYHLIYKHPQMPGVTFECDRTFTNLVDDSRQTHLQGYSLKDFQAALAKANLPVFPPKDVERAKAASYLQGILRSQIKDLMRSSRIDQECARRTGAGDLSLEALLHTYCHIRWMDTFGKGLFNQYLPYFAKDILLDKVEELFYLQWAFSYANRTFMPTICETRYPENELTAVITEYINKVAKERIRQDCQ